MVLQVLHCRCWVDTVTFSVTVTQQSPAAVSMDTYQITAAPAVTKVHTWTFACVWAAAETNQHVWASLVFKCIALVTVWGGMYFIHILPVTK